MTPARSSSTGSPPPSGGPPRAIVYIDGSNLYYSIRHTPYRWLDPLALSRHLFPELEIQQVKYFVGLVNPHSGDPDARARQKTYLRALYTLQPELEVYAGLTNRHKARVALAWSKGSRWRRWLLALALTDRQLLKQDPPRSRSGKTKRRGPT